ncbi:hypothetical protein ACF0H5_019329 [Mactra antiquata]
MPFNNNNTVDITTCTSVDSGLENCKQTDHEETNENNGKKFLKFRRRRIYDHPDVREHLMKKKGGGQKNPVFDFERRNIHLSRPATPQPTPCESKHINVSDVPYLDHDRINNLTAQLDREIDNTANVAQEMHANKAEGFQILSVYNVMRQLTRLRMQLLRIQENPGAATLEIGGPRDIEAYLENIATVCVAAKEIVIQFCEDSCVGETDSCSIDYPRNLEPVERARIRRSSKTESLESVVKQYDQNFSKPETQLIEGNSNTKEGLENYRRVGGRKATKTKRDEKRNKNKLLYKSGTIETLSDTDTDEEMSNMNKLQDANNKYHCPKLNTNDKEKIHEEEKLHVLMSEIDGLMEDVGLTNKKVDDNGLSYEVLMMGCGEMHNSNKLVPKKKSVAPKFAARSFTKSENKPRNNPSKPNTRSRLKAAQSDEFIEEFDKLLDDCDVML